MAATSSNSTSGWPRKACASGCGLCIPNKAGPRSKHPGRFYYKCPGNPPCKRWIGWCDEEVENVAHSGDDWSHKSTSPSSDLQVQLHSLTERISAIENASRVMVVIGIIICVLQVVLVICVLQLFLFVRT